MIFFTSDLHLGHENAISFKHRTFFSCVDEMNTTLIDNINEIVGPDDELWVLGDFSCNINKEEVRALRQRIICRHIHLVYGNHDKDYAHDHIFQSVQQYKELKVHYGENTLKLILFHYPIMDWNSARYGSIHLHGHIHSTGEYNENNRRKLYRDWFEEGHFPRNDDLQLRIYDVGVDANNYKPVSLNEIVQVMGLELSENN